MHLLFGVVDLTSPKYDIEFRGFIEFSVVNSVNPLNSLSYPLASAVLTAPLRLTLLISGVRTSF